MGVPGVLMEETRILYTLSRLSGGTFGLLRCFFLRQTKERVMLRAGLLWLMGVPLFIVVLIYFFFL